MAETFDYVIVGGGTCGLLVANRLSRNPNTTVVVIEPGDDVRDNPNVTDVNGFLKALDTPIDWAYPSVAQSDAGDKSFKYHAGKAIGGTSTINGMTYIRADKAQIDTWEALGNKGWNWDTMLPYYLRVENFTAPNEAQTAAGATYDPRYHGSEGLLKTGFPFELWNGSLHKNVQQAWAGLSYPLNQEVNSGDTRGFSVWPLTLDRDADVREDAARAYYHPVEKRPNLKIIKGTVAKMTWKSCAGTTATELAAEGVEYLTSEGERSVIGVGKEVVLSAGALRTPLVLESSGIGGRRFLELMRIETVIDLPGVGENLQDQTNTALAYASTVNITGISPYATFVTAKDLFGDDTPAIASLTNTSLAAWAEKAAAASGTSGVDPKNIERLFRIQHDLMFNRGVTIGEILTTGGATAVLSVYWFLLPFSRGSVHLAAADEIDAPAIDPRFFQVGFDLDAQVAIAKRARAFWSQEPVRHLAGTNAVPGDDALPPDATDTQWATYQRDFCGPNHHSVGTAAMMAKELGGVVDAQLKVYGTKNVRVVDASVLPFQISGHLTATLYALAERASDIILGSS